ncbi:uncharacterized protein YALI1_F28998g [Yarrowia lipolytica]|uniref:Uncharacterized protein n=1 Tax=Yarrowia lipolytica TaxID=4952 RepID=A0A1D8NPI2_YARLL|nr:hypothetical protein YALI1_F28998g [Yarrowia lipolytica]
MCLGVDRLVVASSNVLHNLLSSMRTVMTCYLLFRLLSCSREMSRRFVNSFCVLVLLVILCRGALVT